MAIEILTYPVEKKDGQVINLFAGFQDVEIQFQRKDNTNISIGESGGNIELTVNNLDITSYLNVGEPVYIYAAGATYTYNGSYNIVSINFASPNTIIVLDGQYIENASSGYCNFYQNYFLEAKLVNADNSNILQYPSPIADDGSNAGLIKINTSMLVDGLDNDILLKSGQVESSRNMCKVVVREVYRENQTNPFVALNTINNPFEDGTILTTPIIIVYAADNSEDDKDYDLGYIIPDNFVNRFSEPKIWDGYPFSLSLARSQQNKLGTMFVNFNELDINKEQITSGNYLHNFKSTDYGLLQVNFNDKNIEIDSKTRYIEFTNDISGQADYQTGDYNDNDYQTINTP